MRSSRRWSASTQAVVRSMTRSRRWSAGYEHGACTWARIGEALGMTRQSAWERFSGED